MWTFWLVLYLRFMAQQCSHAIRSRGKPETTRLYECGDQAIFRRMLCIGRYLDLNPSISGYPKDPQSPNMTSCDIIDNCRPLKEPKASHSASSMHAHTCNPITTILSLRKWDGVFALQRSVSMQLRGRLPSGPCRNTSIYCTVKNKPRCSKERREG